MVEAMQEHYLSRIGTLIRTARQHRGWTQAQLADVLGSSQSAINRVERGHQNVSLEMVARIGEALDSEIVSIGTSGPMHLRVEGEIGRASCRERAETQGDAAAQQ